MVYVVFCFIVVILWVPSGGRWSIYQYSAVLRQWSNSNEYMDTDRSKPQQNTTKVICIFLGMYFTLQRWCVFFSSWIRLANLELYLHQNSRKFRYMAVMEQARELTTCLYLVQCWYVASLSQFGLEENKHDICVGQVQLLWNLTKASFRMLGWALVFSYPVEYTSQTTS